MSGSTTTTNKFVPFDATFRVRLEMLSDWHIGSGTGRPGEVDRLVLRDDKGLPFVPAKTLTGIWRDACERAALGLDDGEPGAWCRWVSFLFGEQAAHRSEELKAILPEDFENPLPAALSVRAAHLPPDLIQVLASEDKHAVREAVTFLKPGVSLDARSGRAREKHLRFEEMARMDASLTAQCEIAWGNYADETQRAAQQRAATALLLAGARLLERLGGKRRRGAGRCALTILDGPELETVWQWVESLSAAQVPIPPALKNIEPFKWDKPESRSDWTRVRLTLITETPVVVSTRTVGNFVETADYIPGTYLLAIIRRTLQPLGVNLNTAIVNGDLLVTNATCEIGDERGRPTPLCLVQEKLAGGLHEGKGIYNRICETGNGKQLKSRREGYLGATIKDSVPAYRNVSRGIRMHNVVLDELQRPHEDVGGVYSYQSINAGQTLRAEFRLRTSLAQKLDEKNPDWFTVLNGTHRLGRSKKDDYGVIGLVAALADSPPAPEAKQTELTIWLLSNLLLRDERLRPTASVEALRKALEIELKKLTGVAVELLMREQTEKAKLPSSLTRLQRIDSWQVSWGLPRPSLAGLAAGSCVVFDIKQGAITKDDLKQLAAQGLGERRAEGFGQLCFNDPLLDTKLSEAPPRCDDAPAGASETRLLTPKQSTFDYARVIERDAVRREIQRQALAFASDSAKRKDALGIEIKARKSHPPMSQLGALRSILSRLGTDKPSVLAWLAHLEDRPNRFEKWKHGLQALRDLLDEPVRVNTPKCVWELLNFDWSKLVITETGEHELKTELWAEAVRALVDACVRAQKRELEKTLRKGDQDNGA